LKIYASQEKKIAPKFIVLCSQKCFGFAAILFYFVGKISVGAPNVLALGASS
jgi:hypothetical protein